MKTLLTILLLTATWCQATPPPPIITSTGRIPLGWAPSPSTNVVRYKLSHSTNDLNWHTNYFTTGTNYTVTGLVPGSRHWFVVQAVNEDGVESVPSNVFEKPIGARPEPAGPLIGIPVTTDIQWRQFDLLAPLFDVGQWVTVKTHTDLMLVGTTLDAAAAGGFRAVLNIGTPVELVKLR
jgi:hypothetical protein